MQILQQRIFSADSNNRSQWKTVARALAVAVVAAVEEVAIMAL